MAFKSIKKFLVIPMRRLGIIILLYNAIQMAYPQQNNTLFFMHTLPQSNLTNPAVQIPCQVFVGVPALSSIHFNYSNSYFSYNDLIVPDGDSLNINLQHFENMSGSVQDIAMEFHLSLINFGFLYKDFYFNFNLSEKVEAGIVYPGNWFKFLLNGNTQFAGETVDLGGAGLYAAYYREWAFGASKIINDELTLGAKVKVLFGKANITTSKADIDFYTGLPVYPLTGTTDIAIKASPLILNIDQNGRVTDFDYPGTDDIVGFLLNSKNKGAALDFGFIWKRDQQITISGSLLDLGLIRWAYYPSQVRNRGTLTYSGYNSRFQLRTFENTEATIDSFQNFFRTTSDAEPYFSFLSPKLYLGATYGLTKNINAGLLSRNILYHNSLKTSVTASLNTWVAKYLAGTVSWSYMNKTVKNLGAGLSARTPNFGLYVVSDNVYGAFKYKSARTLNIMFGLNMLFGCNCSDSDNSSIKNSTKSSCKYYRERDAKKKRFYLWKRKMKKNSKR